MEFDCGMFDRKIPMDPAHGTYCTDEVASSSNAGIGADPKLKVNLFGGEVQVRPAASEEELLKRIMTILNTYLKTDDLQTAGTIHMHVRIPKLLQEPDLIKHLVRWTTAVWPSVIKEIWRFEHEGKTWYDEWLENCNEEVKSQTYDENALHRMESASDPEGIARALHNNPRTIDDWKNEWNQDELPAWKVKRPAVNFGHLAINETIEFRSFATTTNPAILKNIIEFPLRFLRAGLMMETDPAKICRGLVYQDSFRFPYKEFIGPTSQYFACEGNQRKMIAMLLLRKKITLADLNYPQFWIDKGYS